MNHGEASFHWLLEHEIHAASRYRRFVSLLMATCANGSDNGAGFLQNHVRSSDRVFDMGPYSAALMTETDPFGARSAAERLADPSVGNPGFCFAAGSFPGDGRAPGEFFSTVHRRLLAAAEEGGPPKEENAGELKRSA
ncbi:MAG TPA: hypothetical protein VM492_08180 [Sumerlaeia bacterium]|nr:hypothetical protein [Sumerlaeia bacterium]